MHDLRLELVELEAIEDGAGDTVDEVTLEKERSRMAEAFVQGDVKGNGIEPEAIEWWVDGTWVFLEKNLR